MAITLRRLLEFVKDEELQILTGEDNLDRVVRWTHVVEAIEISTFLEGQEVALTTGVALKSEEELFDLVKCIIDNQATALIINTGPYIKKVPQNIIDYCAERSFPLITTPWETHMARIMQMFCRKITEEGMAGIELSSAVKNAIFFPEQKDVYVPALERYHYSAEWSYCVAMIEVLAGAQKIEKERQERLQKYIENHLSYRHQDVIIFEMDEKILLIFNQMNDHDVQKILDEVIKNYQRLLRKEESSYIGIGQSTKSMQCISRSYHQALGALKLEKTRNHAEEASLYSELGMYKLFLSMDDKTTIREYYMEMMGKLLKYDETSQTDYCQVLEAYLNHSGSVKGTADELFVHRNTINKKINKIEEITGFNLSDLDIRVRFKVAFMIQEIL